MILVYLWRVLGKATKAILEQIVDSHFRESEPKKQKTRKPKAAGVMCRFDKCLILSHQNLQFQEISSSFY